MTSRQAQNLKSPTDNVNGSRAHNTDFFRHKTWTQNTSFMDVGCPIMQTIFLLPSKKCSNFGPTFNVICNVNYLFEQWHLYKYWHWNKNLGKKITSFIELNLFASNTSRISHSSESYLKMIIEQSRTSEDVTLSLGMLFTDNKKITCI